MRSPNILSYHAYGAGHVARRHDGRHNGRVAIHRFHRLQTARFARPGHVDLPAVHNLFQLAGDAAFKEILF